MFPARPAAPPQSPRARHVRRRPAVALAVTGALLLAAGCAADPATTAPSPGSGSSVASDGPAGTLTIVDTVFPPTLDPINVTNSSTNKVVRPAYDTLVAYTAGDDPQLEPMVATDWTVSEDQLTYTFTLRDDVVFHSGNPLTAEDVKYTLDRIKTIGTGIASGLSAYASSAVVSPTEITVTLSSAYHSFLGTLSRAYLLDSVLVSANEGDDQGQSWLADNDAGSGPYVITDNVANQSTTFEAFGDYWRGWEGNHVQTAVFQYLTEAASQQAALESGQADIGLGAPRESFSGFEAKDGYTVDVASSLEGLYVHLNTSAGIMSDPAVRAAVAQAFDYETFAASILQGYGTPAGGPLSPMMSCRVDDLDVPTYDLDAARDAVEAAGVAGQTVSIAYLSTLPDEAQGFEMLQSALTEIGLEVEGMPLAWPAYAELVASPETTPDMAFAYAYPLFPDPNEVLYINYDSALRGGSNYAQYSNPELDELVEQAQTVAVEDACPLYEQAQQILADDVPSLWVSDNSWVTVLGPRVEGYEYNVSQHKSVDIYAIGLKG